MYKSTLYYSVPATLLWPLLWPSSGRYITKDGYIEILQMFVDKCPDVKYCFLTVHGLKYTLKYKIQLKIVVINSDI